MEQIYRIAGMTIGFHPLNKSLCDERLEEFRSDGIPDFVVRVTEDDLRRGQREYEEVDKRIGRPVTKRSTSLLEFKELHRKILEKAPYYGVFAFHGSAVNVGGQAYIIAARSGTGKSTHTKLWRELLGESISMINDDKPMLRVADKGVFVCGTPWNGKHKIGNNTQTPLRAISFLERSEKNWIQEVSKAEIYPYFIRQTFRPEDPIAMAKVLELIGKINVKYYRMGCNMELDAAKMAYEEMSK